MKRNLLLALALTASLSAFALPTYEPFSEYATQINNSGTNAIDLTTGGYTVTTGTTTESWLSLGFSGTWAANPYSNAVPGLNVQVTNLAGSSPFTAATIQNLVPANFPGVTATLTNVAFLPACFYNEMTNVALNSYINKNAPTNYYGKTNYDSVGNSAVLQFSRDVTGPASGSNTLFVSYFFMEPAQGSTGSGNNGRFCGWLPSTNIAEPSASFTTYASFFNTFNATGASDQASYGFLETNAQSSYLIIPSDTSSGSANDSIATSHPAVSNFLGTVAFFVGEYVFNPTTGNSNLAWVNPSTSKFGTASPPVPGAAFKMSRVLSDVDGFYLECRPNTGTSGGDGSVYIANMIIGTTWSYVTGGPEFTQTPPSATNSVASTVKFSATALAAGQSVTYQWQKAGVNLTDGGDISGSSTAILTVSPAESGDAGSYSVYATASGTGFAFTNSTPITLTVTNDPVIATEPQNASAAPFGQAVFTVAANTSYSPLTYQWQMNGVNLTDGTQGDSSVVTGSSSAALTIANCNITDENNAQITCGVTNSLGVGLISSPAATFAIVDPTISAQPQNTTVNYGATANFTATIQTASASVSYAWYKGATMLSNGAQVGGSTVTGSSGSFGGTVTPTLTIAGATYQDAGSYTLQATNAQSSTVSSSAATLTVNDPYITSQPTPASTNVLVGGTAMISVGATGSPTLTYQWRKAGVNLSNGGDISGSSTATLTVSPAALADNGSYTVVVSGPSSLFATSAVATVTAFNTATITGISPGTWTQRVGDHLAYVAVGTAGTGPFYYQWSLNNSPIGGATASSLVVTNITGANAGTYTVTVGNPAATNDSGFSATLNVSSSYLAYATTNLVITRVGDGVQTLSGATGNTVFLDQFTTNGGYVSTIQVPDKGTSQLIDPGTNDAVYATCLTLSSNQQYLNFTGYFETYPFTGGADLTVGGTAFPRAIAAINGLGYYTLAYTNQGLYNGGNHFIRAAYSTDGLTNFWTTGCAGSAGVKYVNVTVSSYATGNGIPSIGLTGSTNDDHLIGLVGTNLVFSDSGDPGDTSVGLASPGGAPTPAPSGVVPTALVLSSTSGNAGSSPNDFAVSPDGNTVYIADDRSTANNGGIERWDTNNAGGFTLSYTLAPTAGTNGARGLTVVFPSSISSWGAGITGAVIYATTAAASTNSLVVIPDAGSGSPATTLATAGPNQLLRGVRFAPQSVPVSIVNQPQSLYVLSNSNAVFTVAYAGDAPFTFQWYNGATALTDGPTGTGSTIFGSATGSLTVSNSSASDNGSYSVTVSDPLPSSAGSASAVLTVINPVNISAGPATQTNNYGDTVTLSVSATGGGTLAYAWKKGNTVLSNGGNVSGSSTAILTLSPVAFSDGATYTAIVSNQASTNSASGVLTVNDPIIVTPPTPQTAECAGSATFSVVANGTGTLTYQWQLGGTALTDGAGISGSSSSSLSLSSLTLLQSGGQYSVVVTGSESVTSSVVSLTVQDTTPPSVTIIGATTTNIECASSFTDPGATASDTCDGSTSVTTSGNVNAGATGTYLLTYTSTDSSGNPGTAIRTVIVGDSTPPMITLIGASTTNIECASSFTDPGATANDACAGSESVTSSGSVNAGAVGTYLLTYIASDASGNSATNTRTVTVTDATAPVVSVNGGASTTNTECHTSFTDPGATANDACAGSTAVTTSGSVDANTVGTYILTYSSTDPSTNTGTTTLTVNIVDTTPPLITPYASSPVTVMQPATYSEAGATASDTCAGSVSVSTSGVVDSSTVGTYYVTYIASDPSGNSATNVLTVDIVPSTAGPGITTEPASVTNNAGTTAIFTVVATGPSLTYQWYKGTNVLSDGVTYAGSATASLTITNVLHASEGSYSVVITNDFGTTSSAPAVLTVVDPYVSVSPANTTNYIGSATPTVFTATGAGTPTLHYQWYSSNTTTHVLAKLSGKTSASFSVTSFATSTPTAYVVVVTNQLSAPNSATATAALVIEPAVTIKTKPKATTTVYAGDNVLFTTAGNNTLQYQWSFVSGVSTNTLAGQTAASLSLTNAGPANMGTYDCTLTGLATLDGGEVAPVASAVLVVNPDPQPKVSIASPKNKAILTNNAVEAGISGSVTNPTMVIDGKLTDKGLVTDVAIVRTFPSALSAAATLFGGPAKQSWTNDSIVLADGTNLFNVFATNVSGNVGSNTLSVFSANTQQLTIVTIGSGTYKHVGSTTYGSTDWTGDTNAYPVLQNTRHYGIEAIPAANCIFSNWMNGATVVSTNPTYTLTMSSGLTLTANVPANPLANLAGVYNGMVTATNGLTNTAASGTIEVTVKSNYTKFAFPFSGKVVFNGTSYALSGGFNLDGQYTGQTVTGGFPVSMNVDWTSGSNQIYGTVAGNSFTAGLEITAPADTLADGAYYLPLPVDTGAWTNYGYATVGVTNGAVKVSGKTYDGGAFTQTTTVDKQGRIPFYTFSRAEIQAAGLTSGSPDNTNTISGTVAFNGGVVSLQSASATNGLPALGSTVTVGTNTVPVLGALYPQVATPTMAAGIVTLSYKSSLHAAVIKGYGIMNGANGVVGSIKAGNGGATYVPFTIK